MSGSSIISDKPGTQVKNSASSTVDPKPPVIRETVESFAVALILAFLFRAFVAEAFVIPTGSMAPTLMGAHKDVRCPECQCRYQCGASIEYNELGHQTSSVVLATTCPLCRFELPLDLKNDANHTTFSGDRIIVSKFAYMAREPDRWDVIVFKFPEKAHINYIKRLVARPNEIATIQHGDIWIQDQKSAGQQEIARKTNSALQAMLQPVFDSKYLSKSLIKAGLPSSFQPYPAVDASETSSHGWKVTQSEEKWLAECQAKGVPDEIAWLRYFHRVIDPYTWQHVLEKGEFPTPIDPYSVRLITDFTHYNAAAVIGNRPAVYNSDGTFARGYRSGVNPRELPNLSFQYRGANFENDGMNWVGDLAAEYLVQIRSGQGKLHLDFVEMGTHFRCEIDAHSGEATFRILKKGVACSAFDLGDGKVVDQVTAKTPITGPGSYRIRMSNIDDELRLWVNGKVVDIGPSGKYLTERFLSAEERVPSWSATDPMDGAPVAIGVTDLDVVIDRAKVWRDIYYVATDGSGAFQDYLNVSSSLQESVPDSQKELFLSKSSPYRRSIRYRTSLDTNALLRDAFMSTPSLWSSAPLFEDRRRVRFELLDDQYFPMGDNSPESSDARAWQMPFVPERLLIGRAILIFYPHPWYGPVGPLFYPNVERMGLIR